MIEAIYQRRSIRWFQDRPIPEAALREILRAGRQAPSPKNRQPWHFIVVSGASKAGMLAAMEEGLCRAERGEGLLAPRPGYIENARFTLRAMSEAPVTVFVMNPEGRPLRADWSAAEKVHELSDMQAIGAAAENMALAVADLGIGSLWNGNIFFAYDELRRWLCAEGELALALSLGYSAQPPSLRQMPRKPLESLVTYRS